MLENKSIVYKNSISVPLFYNIRNVIKQIKQHPISEILEEKLDSLKRAEKIEVY